ncbi:hypothetical protein PRUB_a0888 [Pseudoalteromonas rubra]|uniref:Rhamnogalacturonase A/B/Epimerase-like pectate lyase domain-containing protein n=1 Tax=Pseudoalteromonas rubra TaxID=43658 RepID=A0A8T0C8F8_9GAMM|nr:glycosyl hydrolase family 28-related protein [Pseudoalteromonas rubra]KAF7786352.1 hypothetical protein PRUB_a0888 [Pseudoalteromonas rubra]
MQRRDFITSVAAIAGTGGMLGLKAHAAELQTGTQDTSQIVNVIDFGAKGNGFTDDTDAMRAAHATGRIVYYPAGEYRFTSFEMRTGGIIGEGKNTILTCTDSGEQHAITHTLEDPDSVLINERGALFRDFLLRYENEQKNGFGINLIPSKLSDGNPVENYTSYISNVTIRNFSTSIKTSLVSYMNIENCYFVNFRDFGIHSDMNNETFADNGDNGFINNYFFTSPKYSNAICVRYRAGGLRFIGNKVNGGLIGVDISPNQSSSVVLINSNSIENQTNTGIRFFVYPEDTAAREFGRIVIANNQLNLAATEGSAISINSQVNDFKLNDVNITGNTIYAARTSANLIDLRGVDRFNVVANQCYAHAAASSGVYVHANCSNGNIEANSIMGTALGKVINYSDTVTVNGIKVKVTERIQLPALLAGERYEGQISIRQADFSDECVVLWNIDRQGLDLKAWVSSPGQVKYRIANSTANDFASTEVAQTFVIRRV